MVERFQQLIADAAPGPRRDVDADELWRRGRRRRRTRSAAVAGGALVALALLAVVVQLPRGTGVEFAAQAPRIQGVEAVMPGGGVVAEQDVDGVRVRAMVEADAVCVQALTPDTPRLSADPFEDAAMGCTSVDRLPRMLAADGIVSLGTAAYGWRVFAGLVPDGYTTATSVDGRRWDIVDNLLVIVVDPDNAEQVAAGMPLGVELHGRAGRRSITIGHPVGSAPATQHQNGCVAEHLTPLVEPLAASLVSLRQDHCVLPGRPAPAARFDTSSLGDQQPLDPVSLPADDPLPALDLPRREPGYPAVYLGTVADTPIFLTWRRDSMHRIVACVQSSCGTSSTVGEPVGPLAYSVGLTTVGIDLWTPEDTAVVAAEIAATKIWQRPVSRSGVLHVNLRGRSPDEWVALQEEGIPYRISYLDGDGNLLGEDAGVMEWRPT